MAYTASKGYFMRENMVIKLIKFTFALFVMVVASIIMIDNNLSLYDMIRLPLLMIVMTYIIIDLTEDGE